jgi:hypothetical protein
MRADVMNTRNDEIDNQRGDRDEHEKNVQPLVPSELDIEEGDEEKQPKEKLPPAMPPSV